MPATSSLRDEGPDPVPTSCTRTSAPGGKAATAAGGSGREPSADTTAYSSPARPSPPTRPSRMVTVRGSRAATSGSWVTTTMVVPHSRLTRCSASSTTSREVWWSWLVGSSPSSSPGPARERHGERGELQLPGRQRRRSGCRRGVAEPDELEHLPRRRDLTAGLAGRALGELDVLAGGEVGQQVAGRALEDEAHLGGPERVELGLGHGRQLVVADEDPARARAASGPRTG